MHLRDVVRDYCIQSGFSIVVEKASNWVYTVRCNDERCSWRLHGSKLADGVTWAIKSITGSEHTCLGLQTKNPMVSAKWAKKVLLEDIRADENIPAKSLNRKLFERFGVQMTKSSLYRMKAQALIEIHGGFDVSYSYLPNYCEGIEKACTDLWPNVAGGFYVFPRAKDVAIVLVSCHATSPFTFGKAMKQIQKDKDAARIWLANLGDQSRWSKHKFDTSLKCDVNNTNFVESFNSFWGLIDLDNINIARRIRRVSMVRMATRRENCEKWERTSICPNIVKRVQFLCNESRTCLAYQSGPGEFEIVDGKSTLPVSLNNHTCICNAWSCLGSHANMA
ncbi:Acetyl-coenzyme A carboxylase carboxyl transferase subunit alpha [Bienertia sinuspersici]